MKQILEHGIQIQKIHNKTELKSENHSHFYYELVYARSGNFTYFIEDGMVPVYERNIIFVNKNTMHKAFLSGTPYMYFLVRFTEDFLDACFLDDIKNLFKNRKISLPQEDFVTYDLLFSKMYNEYKNQKKNWNILVKYQLSELITMLAREKNTAAPVDTKLPSFTEDICKYVNNRINEGDFSALNLEKIAEAFYLNPYYLSKKFKKHFGIGLKEYINACKITHAKRLMETCGSITEVAYSSGFEDSNYFSTLFKKHENMTPSEYLKFIKSIKL